MMAHLPFVVAAYGLGLGGLLGLLCWCAIAMRRAERLADPLKDRP